MIDIRAHGGKFGGGKNLRLAFPLFFQQTEPTTSKIGAVWVKMDSAPSGKVYISDVRTPNGVTIANGDFVLNASNFSMKLPFNARQSVIFSDYAANPFQLAEGISSSYPLYAQHRVSDSWVEREFYVWDGSSWLLKGLGGGYLYKEGINAHMEKGVNTHSNSTYYEGEKYLEIAAVQENATAEISTVTDTAVDLTGLSYVNVDWEGLSSNNVYGYYGVMATTYQNSNFALSGAGIGAAKEGHALFARRSEQLDVSSLNGLYYLSFFARDRSSNSGNLTEARVRIHNIWLN